ncbi:MAG: hypothetical protein KatS3mg085_847 [Candidatus Dojkabacteria bacterium]|nr:MAG: hypothetical protein KatS3mg085_847 [Candidatus Dojkabacteria bacterium]
MQNEKIKYFVSGFSAFLIDNAVLIIVSATLFKSYENQELLIFGILSASKTISSSVGLTFSFILNRNWAFEAKNENVRIQIFRFVLVFIFNFFFAVLLYTIFSQILFLIDIQQQIASITSNLMAETVKMVTTYLWYKYFVFIKKDKKLP